MPIFRFDPQRPLIGVIASASDGTVRRLRMAFDTGATQTSISRRAAIRLGFNPDALPDRFVVATADGLATIPMLILPRFRALGLEQTDFRVACLNLPARTGIDGLLGSDFFRRFHIFINYQKGLLVVREAKSLFSRLTFWMEVLFAL